MSAALQEILLRAYKRVTVYQVKLRGVAGGEPDTTYFLDESGGVLKEIVWERTP